MSDHGHAERAHINPSPPCAGSDPAPKSHLRIFPSSPSQYSHTPQVVGYPFSGGQPRAGVDQGPEALVAAGLVDQLAALGWVVEFDEGAIADVRRLALEDSEGDTDIGTMHRPRAVSAVNERVAQDVAAIIERGAIPLTLGGDHSLVSEQHRWTASTKVSNVRRPWAQSPVSSPSTPTPRSFGYVIYRQLTLLGVSLTDSPPG